jgi:UTP--glucose-1-phosphate uridylyltransferase
MLTIFDSPVIQMAVNEARDAGIKHFIFVTKRNKNSIEDDFDRNKSSIEDDFDKQVELELALGERGKLDSLSALNRAKLSPGQSSFKRQQ